MNEDLREIVAKWLFERAMERLGKEECTWEEYSKEPLIKRQWYAGAEPLLALLSTHGVVRLAEDNLPESELFIEKQDIIASGFRRVVPLTGEAWPRGY